MDPTGAAGQALFDTGNVYTAFTARSFNCTPYGFAVGNTLESVKRALAGVDENPAESRQALKEIDRLMKRWAAIEMHCPDAALVKREMTFALRLMRHGVQRRMLARAASGGLKAHQAPAADDLKRDMRALAAEHRKVWLARNRPGGLDDSAAVLERAARDYSATGA
jgi:hypothetical protein